MQTKRLECTLREFGEVGSIMRYQVKELEPANSERLRAALAELFELLEGYGPQWYTEEHHNHAVDALLDLDNHFHSGSSEL